MSKWTWPGLALFASLACGVATAAEFKIATIAPEGSAWMQDLRSAARDIAAATDGRVAIKFYAGGVMGSDKKVLRKIRIGQLQGGAFTASGMSERYPDIVIYGLPLVFENQAEVDYVRARMDPILLQGLEDAGFVSFGFAGAGFAKLMGSEPVLDLAALRGRKVWVPEGDRISYVTMETLDLAPVVLPITDVLTGLQTGLLEFVATPPVGAVILQWYTKVKYLTPAPLAYSMGLLAVDQRAFARLSDADQAAFRTIMGAAYARVDERGKTDDVEAEAALLENGLQRVSLAPGILDAWRKAAAGANQSLVSEGVVSQEILDTMLGHLADYRAGLAAE